jgi:hypothetical protein
MHRRSSVRVETDVSVTVYADGYTFECRAVDLSPDGVVIERTDGLCAHATRPFFWLKFPFGDHGVVALARPAWSRGKSQALRFIELGEHERLTLAEHMDEAAKSGRLLH